MTATVRRHRQVPIYPNSEGVLAVQDDALRFILGNAFDKSMFADGFVDTNDELWFSFMRKVDELGPSGIAKLIADTIGK